MIMRLDKFLVLNNYFSSRTKAAEAIDDNLIVVNGNREFIGKEVSGKDLRGGISLVIAAPGTILLVEYMGKSVESSTFLLLSKEAKPSLTLTITLPFFMRQNCIPISGYFPFISCMMLRASFCKSIIKALGLKECLDYFFM